MLHWTVRHRRFRSMATVPRQESVSKCSMQHRELLKWHCWFASDRRAVPARGRRERHAEKIKIWYGVSRVIKLGCFLYHSSSSSSSVLVKMKFMVILCKTACSRAWNYMTWCMFECDPACVTRSHEVILESCLLCLARRMPQCRMPAACDPYCRLEIIH